jgi:hypothetical protein
LTAPRPFPWPVWEAIWTFRGTSEAKVTAFDRALLFDIVSFADDDGSRAFPGHRRLAARAGCDVRTVRRALARLRRAGVVTWTGGRRTGKPNWYTFGGPVAAAFDATEPVGEGSTCPTEVGSPCPTPTETDAGGSGLRVLPRSDTQTLPVGYPCPTGVGSTCPPTVASSTVASTDSSRPADVLLELPVIESKKSPNPSTWRLTAVAADELAEAHGLTVAEVVEVARDYAAKVAAGERKPYTGAGARGGLGEWCRQVAGRRPTSPAKSPVNAARKPAAALVGFEGSRTGGFHPDDVHAFGKATDWGEYVEAMLARPPAELVRFDAWRDQRKAASP